MKTLIHSIIYSRRIYTSAIYGCTRKYGMVLPACLFPALSKNIDKNLELARMFLINDQMLCVHLCIYDLDNRGSEPIERYVFDLSAMSSLVKEKLTKEEFDKYIETIARYNIFELDEKLNSLKSLDDMNNEFNIYLETVHMKEKEVEVIEDDSVRVFSFLNYFQIVAQVY